MTYYKVITNEHKSLGLRKNKNIMTFPKNIWVQDKTELFCDKRDNGGIWVANNLSSAIKLKRYMMEKYNISCKIFETIIGEILYQNSYRTKTNKVNLIKEIT